MIFIRPFLRPCICSYIQVVSPGLDGVCAFILLMCHICCIVAYTSLSSFQARGGARNVKVLGFSVLDDFILYTCHSQAFAQTCHMSYTIDYLSEGGVSESFCDSDVWCRP